MTIPIADPVLDTAERENVDAVLESGDLADGAEVRAFESAFARYCDADNAIATANGTAALHAALEAVGVGEGSTVVTTPFSFVATANAIRFTGATPVFADIDPDTYNLDPGAVEAAIRTADGEVDAILAVHLYGLPAELERLREIADAHDAALVEDAAQAHGATYKGQPVGAIGDVGCFSFYPTKNMTTGEGGMVTTDRDDVAKRVRRFTDHGRGEETYEHVTLGHNFRMTNLAAAIGRAQLEKLSGFVTRRRANAAHLSELLSETPVTTPIEPDDREHAYHQYTIRTAERDKLRRALADADIDSGVYYPTVLHELESYSALDATSPVAERATDEVISLPIHPTVSKDDLEVIAETVSETLAANEAGVSQ